MPVVTAVLLIVTHARLLVTQDCVTVTRSGTAAGTVGVLGGSTVTLRPPLEGALTVGKSKGVP